MPSRTLSQNALGALLLLSGCLAPTPDKDGRVANNGTAQNSSNSSSSTTGTNGISGECGLGQVAKADGCGFPARFVSLWVPAVVNLSNSFADPLLCSDELVDPDTAVAFVDSDEVIFESDDCRVTRDLEEPNPSGFEPGGADFGEATISGPDGTLVFTEESWEGCLVPETPQSFFVPGGTYDAVVTGGTDSGPFEQSFTLPGDPEGSCPEATSGEPLLFEWTTHGAEQVWLQVSRGVVDIDCRVDDTGSFELAPELTAFLPEDGTTFLSYRPRTSSTRYDAESDTRYIFGSETWFACPL